MRLLGAIHLISLLLQCQMSPSWMEMLRTKNFRTRSENFSLQKLFLDWLTDAVPLSFSPNRSQLALSQSISVPLNIPGLEFELIDDLLSQVCISDTSYYTSKVLHWLPRHALHCLIWIDQFWAPLTWTMYLLSRPWTTRTNNWLSQMAQEKYLLM